MQYKSIQTEIKDGVCFLQFDRPSAKNAINAQLIMDCNEAISACQESISIIVLSGSPEVFSLGADFESIAKTSAQTGKPDDIAEALYDLWLRLATGPHISISHVRGRVNAGGVGFVAASDLVIAAESAQFSLSEMLFGLYPACVMPFLIRRIGFQRAHHLTLMATPVSAKQACEWGLADACGASEELLTRYLRRLRRMSNTAIRQYKGYMSQLYEPLRNLRSPAVAANRQLFSDSVNLQSISRYVQFGVFPWEDTPVQSLPPVK